MRYGNVYARRVGQENRCDIDAKRSNCGEPREWDGRYLAGKWDEVVFTETVNGYFPDKDHLVVIFSEDCVVDNV